MKNKRIYSLDLLKFIVSIIIILLHVEQETRLGISIINLASGKFYTHYITELFFIISGFLSMFNFSDEQNGLILKKSFPSFFIHICIRIYPIAILSIVFTLFCGILYRIFLGYWWHNFVPSLWRLLKTLTLMNGGVLNLEATYGFPTWYLSVLLLCYCLEYFIVYICKRFALKVEYLFVFMILLGITGYGYNLNLPLLSFCNYRGYASFFIGCMIFIIYNNKTIEKRKIIAYSIIGCSICLISWIINFDLFYDDETCQWGIFTVVMWPSIFIIFLELNKFFKSPKWQILGVISFEMYLFHMPFILLYLIFSGIFLNFLLPEMIQIIVFLVFMIIISFVINIFIEKPIYSKFVNKLKQIQ